MKLENNTITRQQQGISALKPQGREKDGTQVQSVKENRDVCVSTLGQSKDLIEMLKECLSEMEGDFSSVSITVADLNGKNLSYFAASLGKGVHLTVSSGFLKRMGESEEAYEKGKLILQDILNRLSAQQGAGGGLGAYADEDSVTFWSAQPKESDQKLPWQQKEDDYKNLFQMMEEMRKRAEEMKAKFQIRVDNSIYRSGPEVMSRLARASTASGVKSAIALAERNLCSLKLVLSLGPEKDRAKARAAIADLEKVIARGGRKIRELNEEDILMSRKKRAEQEQLERKAEQIKNELDERKRARQAREHAQAQERPMSMYQWKDPLAIRKLPYEEYQFVSSTYLSGDIVSMPVTADGGMGAFEISPADVVVSPAVEISI